MDIKECIEKIREIETNVLNGMNYIQSSKDPHIMKMNQNNGLLQLFVAASQQAVVDTLVDYLKSKNSSIVLSDTLPGG